MATVTLPGGVSGGTQNLTFDTAATQNLAQVIADAISGLPGSSVSLVTNPGGSTIPSGYAGIVINPTVPVTVTAAGSASVAGNNEAIAFIGSANQTYSVALGDGNNTVGMAVGTTFNVAVGNGNNFIGMNGAGSGTVSAGTGTNTILGAVTAGSKMQIYADGSGDLIAVGAGAATIGESGAHSAIFGGAGPDLMVDAGTNDTLVGGSGAETMYGGSMGVYFTSSDTTEFVSGTLPNSSDTIIGVDGSAETIFGGTSDVIFANNSSLTFVSGAGSATILGGAGHDTMFGEAGGRVTFFGSAGQPGTPVYVAGPGSESFDASNSSSGMLIVATGGSANIVGASGADTTFAGAGNNTLTGGAASNLYCFVNGAAGGNTVITDFKTTGIEDSLLLFGYGANEVSNALASATVSNGSTTITLADNTKITFLGVSQVNASQIYGY